MSLYSVQKLVRDTLDGLETADELWPAAQAFISPPVADEVDRPKIYVWGSQDDEKRETMGRGVGGRKHITTDLNIWYVFLQAGDDPHADAAFPTFIWAIRNALRTLTMPQDLNDDISGELSHLISIGERMHNIQGEPRLLEDQRYMWMNGRLTVRVEEDILG